MNISNSKFNKVKLISDALLHNYSHSITIEANNEFKLLSFYICDREIEWGGSLKVLREYFFTKGYWKWMMCLFDCWHLLSICLLKDVDWESHLLCNQLTYSNSKEHMSNSTKEITMTIDFMITCPLDHSREHIVSIPSDIMVLILRIPVATSLHQLWHNL